MKNIEIKDDKWINAEGYKKQILASSEDFDSEGVLAQVVVIGPGSVVRPHYHKSTYEYYYVMQGDVAFTINGEIRRLKAGEMMMTEPNDIHKVENDSDEDFMVLVFKSNYVKNDTYWAE
ncbi:MAG TPA: cupin domain-containing protein [candidate division Zixibacteria bacterium]|nr:cupin domain-containing protein [candidate division Zixibacteria bacterium]